MISFFHKRKFLLAFGLLILALILFKGSIYRACFSYKLLYPRHVESFALNEYPSKEDLSPKEICQTALDITADNLSFTTAHCETDPKALYPGAKTNCIGYAAECAMHCNNEIPVHSDNRIIKAEPWVAEIYFFGFNIHHLFSSPFWKDHDIVVVSTKNSDEKILLDPTLYDYTGVGFVSEK